MSVRVQALATARVLSGVLGLAHPLVVTAQGTPTTQGAADLQALRQRAESGDPEAQFNLGVRYNDGQSVPQDDAQAAIWIRKAAEQGYADAQLNLGARYNDGYGVPQDYAQAAAWYRKAADKGIAQARHNLGLLYDKG